MKRPRPGLQRESTWRDIPGPMRAHLTHGEIVISQGQIVSRQREMVPPQFQALREMVRPELIP